VAPSSTESQQRCRSCSLHLSNESSHICSGAGLCNMATPCHLQVLDDFVPVRIDTYQRRKAAQLEALKSKVTKCAWVV
jgi:hypothetical protein